ncbi:unnamed protein product [Trypanosoma congolense IL3000]|uniref:WGS project CAEQ00000000 data, annotated contig 1757 n=1 Tax=Trypanosoma congolense (strain IL3000) TaxID=1068625 RepID=F9W8P6_TRYCI|nr:unnamed protein product [Trypanosoma congolense IL3000]
MGNPDWGSLSRKHALPSFFLFRTLFCVLTPYLGPNSRADVRFSVLFLCLCIATVMDELQDLHHSIIAVSVGDSLLQRVMNFTKRRSLDALHSIRWRLLTGLLSVAVNSSNALEQWEKSTRECVAMWNATNKDLRNRRGNPSVMQVPVPKRTYSEGDDPSDEGEDEAGDENPLIPREGSRYAFRCRLDALQSAMLLDADRIDWDIQLFSFPDTRESLRDILLNYCVQHDCEYKQGMHEVAAFVFYITHSDATKIEQLYREHQQGCPSLPGAFRFICPIDDVTALSYHLFDAIMSERGVNLTSWYFERPASRNSGIKTAMNRVQSVLLLLLDKELHKQMDVVYELPPATYLLRWLRLLFLREFSLEQCADLWDVFLSERFAAASVGRCYDIQNCVITMLAAVMLLNVKAELMKGPNEAITCVMKYPSVDNVASLIQQAIFHLDSAKKLLGQHITLDVSDTTGKELFEGVEVN